MPTKTPPICDYEGSDYRERFWEGRGRSYEDRVERIALRRLMPPTGSTLIEIGAGFGRLANEYTRYDRVVLFDYSRSLLQEAQAHLGGDPRFIYVVGNWYKMPFVSGLFQTLVQVRTLHHAADVPALFQQLARIAQPNSAYLRICQQAQPKSHAALLAWPSILVSLYPGTYRICRAKFQLPSPMASATTQFSRFHLSSAAYCFPLPDRAYQKINTNRAARLFGQPMAMDGELVAAITKRLYEKQISQ